MIQTTIINYLLQKRYCTLPGVGQLLYMEETQAIPQADKIMFSRSQNIVLKQYDSEDYKTFFKSLKACAIEAQSNVELEMGSYCDRILSLKLDETLGLLTVGHFYRDAAGSVAFEADAAFKQITTLHANRIVRADARHQMLVGDTATNTESMAAYYNNAPVNKKSWWWVAAIVIALAAAGLVAAYFFAGFSNGAFGNAVSIF